MHCSSPRIFISYRGCDQPWAAAVVDHVLVQRFGDDSVFLSSRSIPPGAAFDTVLQVALRRSDVVLAIVGERWLTAKDGHGRRLIDARQDWVRREIAIALAEGKTVVPVLVGDVPRLHPRSLPASIRRLATCQYVRLRYREARQDLGHLVNVVSTLRCSQDGFHRVHATARASNPVAVPVTQPT
jgi:hypothetical protein